VTLNGITTNTQKTTFLGAGGMKGRCPPCPCLQAASIQKSENTKMTGGLYTVQDLFVLLAVYVLSLLLLNDRT